MDRDVVPSMAIVHNLCHEQFLVTSDLLASPRSDDPGQSISTSRIEYGQHQFKVAFSDGKTLWLEHFLTDAGRVANVEMFIAHTAGTKMAHVKVIRYYRPTIFGGSYVWADQEVDITTTSPNSPALGGV